MPCHMNHREHAQFSNTVKTQFYIEGWFFKILLHAMVQTELLFFQINTASREKLHNTTVACSGFKIKRSTYRPVNVVIICPCGKPVIKSDDNQCFQRAAGRRYLDRFCKLNNPGTRPETGRAKGAQKWCFHVVPTRFRLRRIFDQNSALIGFQLTSNFGCWVHDGSMTI